MRPRTLRDQLANLGLVALVVALAMGWLSRERAFAADQAMIASTTIPLDKLKMGDYRNAGKLVGKIGIYLDGDTPASSKFVTGRLVLDAGQTPHPPHTHPEEEIMVLESGHGEIEVDGKITKVGPGSVMYTTPNVPHGIVNTGTEPIVFTFIKWAPRDGK